MATIIEIQESKLEHLSECAEKVLKYSGKLMQCLEEVSEGKGYMEKYGKHRRNRMRDYDDEEDYQRYY